MSDVVWTDDGAGGTIASVCGVDVFVSGRPDGWLWSTVDGGGGITHGRTDTQAEAKAAAEAHARGVPDSGEALPGQREYLVEAVGKVDILLASSPADAAQLWAKTAKVTVGAQVRVSRLVGTRSFAVGVREVSRAVGDE